MISSPKLICIFEVSEDILTRYTSEMIRKKGRNMVKNALVKFDEMYPFTLTINDSLQELCCLGIVKIDDKGS